jgi:hypothetical protein
MRIHNPVKKKIFFCPLEGFSHGVFVVYKKEKMFCDKKIQMRLLPVT